MKNLVIISTLLLSSFSFAETRFKCQELIDGNSNGKAILKVKSVDIELKVSKAYNQKDTLLISGNSVAESRYGVGDENYPVSAYLGKTAKIKLTEESLVAKDTERHLVWCEEACRVWTKLTMDLVTGETEFIHQYSGNKIAGDVRTVHAIKMKCQKY